MKFNTKLVLGIESTAHTWSVGIMGFNGEVFSVVNDTFIPDIGGLHPYLVKVQHLTIFMRVI